MTTESRPSVNGSLSDAITEHFQPIVAQFGFTRPTWAYSADLEIVRVHFEDPRGEKAVQIDRHVADGSYSANYCRMDDEWQVCVEGKHRSFAALSATLPKWIRRHCRECRTQDVKVEETQE